MKNLKLGVCLALICFVFVFIWVFSPTTILCVNADGETEATPILIEDEAGLLAVQNNKYYKLTKNLELNEDYWEPIGTVVSPFTNVHFNGNGKTITIKLKYDSSSSGQVLGLFGVIKNTTIKNLTVKAVVELSDGGVVVEPVRIGAIAGRAENSNIFSCHTWIDLKAQRIEQGAEPGTEEIQTNKYKGEIIAGGVIGEALYTSVYDCAVEAQIKVEQDGTNVVNSYFGGVAGKFNDGKIYNVYVAPSYSESGSLIDKIKNKNGVLTAIAGNEADIIISNRKDANSEVVFGGIVGFARGASLNIYNTVFSSMISSETPTKLLRGGIIGKVSTNPIDHPRELLYSKYLNILNSDVLSFSGSVGNSSAASYITHSSNTNFNQLPNQAFFTAGSWHSSTEWDYENVWKVKSVIAEGGYFFPLLQAFSTYTIKLADLYTVKSQNNQYSSGYIILSLMDGEEVLIDDDGILLKEKEYDLGQEVKIRASFYSDENNNFKNFYRFTYWLRGDISVVEVGKSSSAGYVSTQNPADESTTLTFNASSQTEGTYGIGLVGEEVTVSVYFGVEGGSGSETAVGSINQTVGNKIENRTGNFTLKSVYQSGAANVIEAVNNPSSNFLFTFWQDGGLSANDTQARKLIFELDNTKESSQHRFYPKVVYDSTDNRLEAQIICVFSNNTSLLTLNITEGGGVSIDGGTAIKEQTHNENLVKNRQTTLVAIPDEGYRFEGWYLSSILLSKETQYTISIESASWIEARFSAIETSEGLAGWIIAIIVIGSLLVVGAVVLIIIKVKKKSFGSYKKNYRY
jgi:hypothetical protein